LGSIIDNNNSLSNATHQRAVSENLPTAIGYSGYASNPEVGLVITGGTDDEEGDQGRDSPMFKNYS
jgi:hypothetical protein